MVVSKVQFSKDIFSSFFVLANMNAFVDPIVYYVNIQKKRSITKGGTYRTKLLKLINLAKNYIGVLFGVQK